MPSTSGKLKKKQTRTKQTTSDDESVETIQTKNNARYDNSDNEVSSSAQTKTVRFANPDDDDDESNTPKTTKDRILSFLSQLNDSKSIALLVILTCFIFLVIVSIWYLANGIKTSDTSSNTHFEPLPPRFIPDSQKFKLQNSAIQYVGSRVILDYIVSNYLQESYTHITLYDSPLCSNGGIDISDAGYFTPKLFFDHSIPIGDGSLSQYVQLSISMNGKLLNSQLYNDNTNATYRGGNVEFCVGFAIYDSNSKDARMERNYVETAVNLNVEFNNNIGIQPIGIQKYSHNGN